MKKIRFFILFFVILSAFFLGGCANPLGKYQKYVSEYRDQVLVGSSDAFEVEAISGYRESPFCIDGSSGEKSDFFLATVTPSTYDPNKEYAYKVTLDGVEYEGKMVKHPFENTYSFEVAARCSEQAVTVTIDGQNIELSSVITEDFIMLDKAFEIALKRLKNNRIVKDGNYEIYVRLIANPINASGGYFWYVAFVDQELEVAAVLIEPISMEITAVRE